jgi:hypothetical protein
MSPAIMDGFLKDGIKADKVLKDKQNKYLADQKKKEEKEAEKEKDRLEAEKKKIDKIKDSRVKPETKEKWEQKKENLVSNVPSFVPGPVAGVRKVEVVTVNIEDKQRVAMWLINHDFERNYKKIAATVEEINKIDMNSHLTRLVMTLVHAVEQIRSGHSLMGLIDINKVGLAKHCKEQKVKNGEIPGIEISRDWDAQLGS